MSRINIANLKSGMVLTSPVMTPSGNILLKEGVLITDKHIGIFKKWGVWEVEIQGNETNDGADTNSGPIAGEMLQEIDGRLKERFPFAGENPVMMEIMRIVRKIEISKRSKKT